MKTLKKTLSMKNLKYIQLSTSLSKISMKTLKKTLSMKNLKYIQLSTSLSLKFNTC